jgi:glutamate N-acetyltransferase/amino-acid N-acetyltransferase
MSTKIQVISEGGVTTPKGFLAGATYAGIKKKSPDALDLCILYSEVVCDTAAVFTTNQIKAAPVIIDQDKLNKSKKTRAVVINSGCANACTGIQGINAAIETTMLTAKKLSVSPDEVLLASTGVIGTQLPMLNMKQGIERIVVSREGGKELTKAIMTTDTRKKSIAVRVKQGEIEFTIGGTCKGAGMIHPNMATMLGFLTTDASIESDFLDSSLRKAVDASFNMVSVDGDTSTNDMVVILANGTAGNAKIHQNSILGESYCHALDLVSTYLAKSIAADGEGATRLIEIRVCGARNITDARLAARTISNSPLVKTAVHGCDPNWGRIIAAAGRSGAEVVQDKADVYIGDMCLLKEGTPLPFDKKAASDLLKHQEVLLKVDLNLGSAAAIAWGCDLSNEYVKINSDYTT